MIHNGIQSGTPELIDIRLEKTVKSGTKINKFTCNENCKFDAKYKIICHRDNFYLDGGIAIKNEELVKSILKLTRIVNKKAMVYIAGPGEPTLIKSELVDLIKKLRQEKEIRYIKLITNGTKLGKGKPPLIELLRTAGLDGINISLHSLDYLEFKDITGIDALETVMTGLDKAIRTNIEVKINCIIREKTLNEINNYIELSRNKSIPIKFFSILTKNKDLQNNYNKLIDKMITILENYAPKTYEYHHNYDSYIYEIGGAVIEVKDSRDNKCKNLSCKTREECFEGCRHHIRIRSDGVMQPCGIRQDNRVNLISASDIQIIDALKEGGKI